MRAIPLSECFSGSNPSLARIPKLHIQKGSGRATDTENRRKFTDSLNILQQPTYSVRNSAIAYGKASAL